MTDNRFQIVPVFRIIVTGTLLLLLLTASPISATQESLTSQSAIPHESRFTQAQSTTNVTSNESTVNVTSAPKINRTGSGRIRIAIGGNETNMMIVLDLSMLLNLPDTGTFGVYTWGHANNRQVIKILIAIHFRGIGPIGQFFNNPFSRFETNVTMEMNLPFPV